MIKFWQVDAFTNKIFCGNPATVFIFDQEPSVDLMMKIAKEMNLSETAFVIKRDHLKIRWFTPNSEVNLCGHATLSAAHILWQEGLVNTDHIVFHSRSGPLPVSKNKNGYTLDFPLQSPVEKKAEHFAQIANLLDFVPDYVGSNGEDCMAVVSDDAFIYSYTPDLQQISTLQERGFLLTAQDQSGEFDYIYRAFFPKLNVPEDPVTGSANTCLAAYWSKKLNKTKLKARQVSERGGTLDIEVLNDRVLITGQAVTVVEGLMNLDAKNK